MTLVTWMWRLIAGEIGPTSGVQVALLAGYFAGAILTALWLRSRVLPEFKIAHAIYQKTLNDPANCRSPIDAAFSHLLIEFVCGMGARPDTHSALRNLEHDGPLVDEPPLESRTRIVIGLVFRTDGRNSEFRSVAEAPVALRQRLLLAIESAGIFVVACVLVVVGLLVLPWHLVVEQRVDGRAVTFLILAHGVMQLLGRVHRASRTLDLATGLLRPVAVLLGGCFGLALYDLPAVMPSVQMAYTLAWLLCIISISYLLGQLVFVASARSQDAAQMYVIVSTVRICATLVFGAFAVVNALAVASAGVSWAAIEYVVFGCAHIVSALAVGLSEVERRRQRRIS